MSSSYVPDETPEPSRIRLSGIRVSAHHIPLNIISLDASSSWKSSDSSIVSLSKSFQHLSTDVHQPLYHNLFAQGSALTIVSNVFDCSQTSTVCQHTLPNDVLQSLIWEGANRLISPVPDTLSVDSVHSRESVESHLSSHQSINI